MDTEQRKLAAYEFERALNWVIEEQRKVEPTRAECLAALDRTIERGAETLRDLLDLADQYLDANSAVHATGRVHGFFTHDREVRRRAEAFQGVLRAERDALKESLRAKIDESNDAIERLRVLHDLRNRLTETPEE